MQYLVFDDMTQCTADEVKRLLPCVSVQRREQALKYAHIFGQFCCLKSYAMLLLLLQQYDRYQNTLPEFVYTDYGQPQLADGPYFSISHCRNGIAVAVDENPIGIDIESIRTRLLDGGFVAKVMNSCEQSQIEHSLQPEWVFTRLWTQKEALLKMRGTGIVGSIKDTLVMYPNVSFITQENSDKQYVLTIAKSTI